MTQSTVTMRLKTLEAELGQVLLNRHKSGITLTPAGSRLLNYARVITGLWRQAQLEAGLPTGMSGIINLGCTHDLWASAGVTLFQMIRSRQPDIALSVLKGNEEELDRWVAEGLVDVCVCYEPVATKAQTIVELIDDALVLYSDRPDTPSKFDTQYVFVDHGEAFRREHAEAYFDAGTARITFNSSLAALEFLIAEGGSAYLPRSIVASSESRDALYEVDDAPIFPRVAWLMVSNSQLQAQPWLTEAVALFD